MKLGSQRLKNIIEEQRCKIKRLETKISNARKLVEKTLPGAKILKSERDTLLWLLEPEE